MVLSSLGAVLVFFVLLWVVSLAIRDASIVDRFWGIAFVVIATSVSAATDGAAPRVHLVMVLVAAWALRLSLHITARNLGHGEDYRYQAMRVHWGDRFPLASLATVFLLQGFIAWIVSLPLQAAISSGTPKALGALDCAGAAVWTAGFLFEAVGDFQLMRFKADPASAGKVMNTGLWRYTRHPNYFGDALLWWGFWLIAGATGAWWTAVGPALMTFLLLRVSGVAMLERKLRKTRPTYDDYVRRTSPFLPLPPRRA
jgi:steroid 5-alpha reductase family enzyme